jgi:hypothetical protein
MDSDDIFFDFVSKFDDTFKQLSKSRKIEFINHFISKTCDSNDLNHLIKLSDSYKSDFIMVLPVEVVEIIFSYLNALQLSQCCKVKN